MKLDFLKNEKMNYEKLLRESIKGLEAPTYGELEEGILLNLNTSPLGTNPAANCIGKLLGGETDDSSQDIDLATLSEGFKNLNLYPSPSSRNLRVGLADFYDLDPGQIIVGNGSNETLNIILRAFINPGDRVLYPTPSFSMYPPYIKINMGEPCPIPLLDDFKLDLKSILNQEAKVTIICSPNNPTGNCFETEKIMEIIEKKRLVLIDEAYAEFSDQSFIRYLDQYPNLMISRTFSKAWGLAGIRTGYLIANKKLIEKLMPIKSPYNLNTLSEYLAVNALKNCPDFVNQYKDMVVQERPRLATKLESLGFKTYPSDANFLLAKPPIKSTKLVKLLRKEGVFIKDVSHYPQLAGHVRITVGTRAMNEMIIEKMGKILGD